MGKGRIEPRPGLEVFVNEGGTISIKQIDFEEEAIIVVHPEDVPRLIDLLREVNRDALNLESVGEE